MERAQLRFALSGLALLVMTACQPSRPPASPLGLRPWGVVYPQPRTGELPGKAAAISSDRARAVLPRDADGRRRYSVLALSGGGAYGAYGVGLLLGWSARGTRPQFRIVSGVSTGALIATQAFLGSEHDQQLRKAYTGIESADVYSLNSLASVPARGALADSKGLRRLIERWITPDVLNKVAREFRKGRRLYVSTTNLDEQVFTVWDLSAIAASGRPDRLKRYHDVLQAAASIPIFFPPVYITVEQGGSEVTQMHTDTLHEGVFFRAPMLYRDPVYRALASAGERPVVDLYVVANYPLSYTRDKPLKPDIKSIGYATTDIVTGRLIYGSLLRLYMLARAYPLELNLAVVPAHFSLKGGAVDFDSKKMTKMLDAAFSLAKKGYPWSRHPPQLEASERL